MESAGSCATAPGHAPEGCDPGGFCSASTTVGSVVSYARCFSYSAYPEAHCAPTPPLDLANVSTASYPSSDSGNANSYGKVGDHNAGLFSAGTISSQMILNTLLVS